MLTSWLLPSSKLLILYSLISGICCSKLATTLILSSVFWEARGFSCWPLCCCSEREHGPVSRCSRCGYPRWIPQSTKQLHFGMQIPPIMTLQQNIIKFRIKKNPNIYTIYQIFLPHQRECRSAQHWHLYLEKLFSESLPLPGRFHWSSTEYTLHWYQCQAKQDLGFKE